jgi:RHS repeat-associated protein
MSNFFSHRKTIYRISRSLFLQLIVIILTINFSRAQMITRVAGTVSCPGDKATYGFSPPSNWTVLQWEWNIISGGNFTDGTNLQSSQPVIQWNTSGTLQIGVHYIDTYNGHDYSYSGSISESVFSGSGGTAAVNDATVCEDDQITLTWSGTGTFQSWRRSTNNWSSDQAVGTSNPLTLSAGSQDARYRAVVSSTCGTTKNSSDVLVDVDAWPVAGSMVLIQGQENYGSTGGGVQFELQGYSANATKVHWEKRVGSGSWQSLNGGFKSGEYRFPLAGTHSVTATTTFRATVQSDRGCTSNTNPTKIITVLQAPIAGNISGPTGPLQCHPIGDQTFYLNGSSGNITWYWQRYNNVGAPYWNQGGTGTSQTIPANQFVDEGESYTVVVKAEVTNGYQTVSTTRTIQIQPEPGGGSAAVNDATVCEGDQITLTWSGTGTFQSWRRSTNNWLSDQVVGTSNPLTLSAGSQDARYRAVVGSTCGTTKNSTEVLVDVDALPVLDNIILLQGSETFGSSGGGVQMEVAINPNTNNADQFSWEKKENGGSWETLTGDFAGEMRYPVAGAVNVTKTTTFRATAKSSRGCLSVLNPTKLITVLQAPVAGNISGPTGPLQCHPIGDQTFYLNGSSGNITWYWQRYNNVGAPYWSQGGTGTSQTIPANQFVDEGESYTVVVKAEVTNGYQTVSTTHTVQIQPVPGGGTATVNDATICEGDQITLTWSGTGTFQSWRQSTNNWASDQAAGTSNPQTLTVGSLDTRYRAVVMNTCGTTKNSTEVLVDVDALPVLDNIILLQGSETFGSSGGGVQMEVVINPYTDNADEFSWEKKENGGSWETLTGDFAGEMRYPLAGAINVTKTTTFRATAKSSRGCLSVLNPTKLITVLQPLIVGEIDGPETPIICHPVVEDQTFDLVEPTGATITWYWQGRDLFGAPYWNQGGAGTRLTIPAIEFADTGEQYFVVARADVSNGVETVEKTYTVEIKPEPGGGTATLLGDASCYNNTPELTWAGEGTFQYWVQSTDNWNTESTFGITNPLQITVLDQNIRYKAVVENVCNNIVRSNQIELTKNEFCDLYSISYDQPDDNLNDNILNLGSNGGLVRFGVNNLPSNQEIIWEIYEAGEMVLQETGVNLTEIAYNFTYDGSVRVRATCCADEIGKYVIVNIGNSMGGEDDMSGTCLPPSGNEYVYNAGIILPDGDICPGSQTSFTFNFQGGIERFEWTIDGGDFVNTNDELSENPTVQWDTFSETGMIKIDGYYCYRGEPRLFTSSLEVDLKQDLEPTTRSTCENGIAEINYPYYYTSINFYSSVSGVDNDWSSYNYTLGDNIIISNDIFFKADVTTTQGCTFTTDPIKIEVYSIDEKPSAPALLTQQVRCGVGTLELELKNTFDTYQWVIDGVTDQVNDASIYTLDIQQLNESIPIEVTGIAEDGCTSEVLKFQTKATDNCVNYVFTTASQEEGVGTIDDLNTLTYDDKSMGWTYFDGFGRSLQSVSQQSSPLGNDVIQHIEYDEFGREKATYLPYINNDGVNNGYYRYGAKGATETFYTAPEFPKINSTNTPFAQKVYEPSPLNRLVATGAPGDTWDIGSGHEATSEYHFNVVDEVINWKADASGQVYLDIAYYLPNQLYKTVVANENGSRTINYTDQLGREILKKTQIENAVSDTDHFGWACTYNVYDDLGNLRVVLQPQLIEDLRYDNLITDGYVIPRIQLDELAFQYRYDKKKRMSHKKIPGKSWEYMTYDTRNRLVLSQDGNLREDNEWLFTKYDALNRSVMTGIYTHSGSETTQEDMQGYLNGAVGQGGNLWYESIKEDAGNLHGYDNKSFPTSNIEVISVTYYNGYHFVGKDYFASGSTEFQYKSDVPTDLPSANPHLLIKGQTIGSKVRILDPLGGEVYLHSVNYFDDKLRSIQTITQNHLDGTERVTYCFDDNTENVKESYLMADAPESMTIRRWFTYDHGGRLLSIDHQIDNGEKVNIVQNTYNELDELTQKVLHSSGNYTPTQTIDYKYNIRGWLTHINDASLSEPSDLFGMELYYHEGFQVPVYNGNISGVKWKTALDQNRLAYGYIFDHMDRIKGAHFVAGVNNSWIDDGMYNLEIVGGPTGNGDYFSGYDNNGNIKSLRRFGKVDQNQTAIEVLNYNYTGNKLLSVADNGTEEGFKDGTNTGDDYEYDVNGNMRVDLNKGITNISYNFLNLPETIEVAGMGRIEYVYDAAGIKLAQRIYADGATESATVTDYIGERIYETNVGTPRTLQMIHHEEGRVIPGPAPGSVVGTNESPTWEYQYYLKDHLGNARVTYGIPTYDQYLLTMEVNKIENRIIENQEFENVIESEYEAPAGLNHTQASDDIIDPKYVVWLDGVTRVIGPGKSIKVLPGDQVDIDVYVKFLDNTVTNESVTVGMLLSGFFGSFVTVGSELLVRSIVVTEEILSSLPIILDPTKTYSETTPHAYVNVIMVDSKDKEVLWGRKYAISDDGKFALGDPDFGGLHEHMDLDPMTIEKEGYMYIYLSNESKMRDVYFDDLLITHTHSPIVQKDDYYPFGLGIAGLSTQKENSFGNKWTFQGQERQDALDLGWYGFKWRNHQPELGRFFNVDPLSEDYKYYSTFAFSGNNVVNAIELEGLEPIQLTPSFYSGFGNWVDQQQFNATIYGGYVNYGIASLWSMFDDSYNIGRPVVNLWDHLQQRDDLQTAYENGESYHHNLSADGLINQRELSYQRDLLSINAQIAGDYGDWAKVATNWVGSTMLSQQSALYSSFGRNMAMNRWMISGGVFPDAGKDIALGLGDDLFNFAKSKGYITYREFSTGFQKEKIAAAINNTNNNLHFDLTGFSRWRFSKFDPSAPLTYGNYTNWELHYIYNTPGALERTTFYRYILGSYQIQPKPF